MAKKKDAGPPPAVLLIPIKQIVQSPDNPRKFFDQAKLDQLAESIKEKGVLQPIVVRPNPYKKGAYELVAGERRWRACDLAGVAAIPAMVRELDDKAAVECAVTENDQREDVQPLEQANGYKRLMDLGDDLPTIAFKTGRTEAYVAERVQLLRLIPELQADLAAGHLPVGHAKILAKMESPEDQKAIRDEDLYEWHPDECHDGRTAEAYPLTQLLRTLEDHYRRDLAGVPWKLDDKELVPAAGSCDGCPKRSATRPTLFDALSEADGRKNRVKDHCFDRACFDAKKAAVVQLGVDKVKAAAGADAEVLKVSPELWHRGDDEVLTADRYEVLSKKDAAAAKPAEVRQAVVSEGKDAGKVVTVRVKKQAEVRQADRYSRHQRELKKKAETGRRASLAANGLVAAKVVKWFKGVSLPPAATAMIFELARVMPDVLWSDACRLVAKRRGIKQDGTADRKAIEAHVDGLDTAADALALIFELVAARRSFDWGSMHSGGGISAGDKAWWAAFGVDRAQLIREAAAAEPKKKPAVNGKAEKKAKKKAKAAK